MKLLLISNSTNTGEAYLEYCKQNIADFLQQNNVRKILFFPFAAVTFSYDIYQQKVKEKLEPFGIDVDSIHHYSDAKKAVAEAQAIVVGGGNTFHLLKCVQELGLIEAIKEKVKNGTPYIGWSAGSNLTCPTICTTNDMPIVEPQNFSALGLIPFQINPHYLDAHPTGHAGETREQRIEEYIAANPNRFVAGLREACMFYIDGYQLRLQGSRPLRVFKKDTETKEYEATDDINFLMK
ncbi:MAG: dipeptidase PepE [Prevotellaceae bacterium]|jgi:dipeptidase E|nr:dipeptidase PepE [Prevotellaceae bacterium]